MNVVKRKKSKRRSHGTFTNKLCACAIMSAGMLGVFRSNDATFLIIATTISLPLFFAKENWI